MTRPNTSTTLDKHSLNTHTQRHVILRFISLLLRGAYCGCGDSQNNRFFPQFHPGLQAHYTDWSIQPNLIHNTQDPWSVRLSAYVRAWLRGCVRACVQESKESRRLLSFHCQKAQSLAIITQLKEQAAYNKQ